MCWKILSFSGHRRADTAGHRNIMREHRRMHRHFVLLLLPTACADLHDAETMTPAKVLDNARICSFQQPCESFAAWQSAHSKWEREPTTVQRGCSHCNIDGLARLPADEVFHSSAVVKDERELASPSSLDYTDIFTRPGINRTWLMQRCRYGSGAE